MNFLDRFSKNIQISDLMKNALWFPSCSMRTDIRTDAPKNYTSAFCNVTHCRPIKLSHPTNSNLLPTITVSLDSEHCLVFRTQNSVSGTEFLSVLFVPRTWPLVTGLLSRKPWFKPRPLRVRFVVNKKWHSVRFYSQLFSIPLSLSFYQCSLRITYH